MWASIASVEKRIAAGRPPQVTLRFMADDLSHIRENAQEILAGLTAIPEAAHVRVVYGDL